jgi:hypothetical protein
MKEMPNLYQSYSAPLFGKNYKVEGITKINNEDTYAISFTEKTAGVDMIYYYSVKTGLLTATEGTVKSGGVNYTTKNYLSDYKDVNGILHPFKTKSTSQNFTSETITKEIKFNEGVFDTDFQVN